MKQELQTGIATNYTLDSNFQHLRDESMLLTPPTSRTTNQTSIITTHRPTPFSYKA